MVSPRLKDNKQAIRGRVTKARDAKDKENWQQNWNSRRSEYDDKKQQREKWEGAVKDLGARPGSGGDKRPQESGEKKGQGDWEMEGMEGKESLTPKAAPKKRCGQTEMRGDMRHRGPQKGQKAGEWEAYRNNNRRDAPEGKNAGEQGKGGRYLTRGRSDEPDQKKERGRYCFRMGKRALREATKRTEIQGSITAPPPPQLWWSERRRKEKGAEKINPSEGCRAKRSTSSQHCWQRRKIAKRANGCTRISSSSRRMGMAKTTMLRTCGKRPMMCITSKKARTPTEKQEQA